MTPSVMFFLIRYACADLVRGYSPSEAAEFRAIASFHHPDGYAWGYVRFVSEDNIAECVMQFGNGLSKQN